MPFCTQASLPRVSTCVLSWVRRRPYSGPKSHGKEHYWIDLKHLPSETCPKIADLLPRYVAAIEVGEKVLINCWQGLHRTGLLYCVGEALLCVTFETCCVKGFWMGVGRVAPQLNLRVDAPGSPHLRSSPSNSTSHELPLRRQPTRVFLATQLLTCVFSVAHADRKL